MISPIIQGKNLKNSQAPSFSSCNHFHPYHPQPKIISSSFCALVGLLLTELKHYLNDKITITIDNGNDPPILIYVPLIASQRFPSTFCLVRSFKRNTFFYSTLYKKTRLHPSSLFLFSGRSSRNVNGWLLKTSALRSRFAFHPTYLVFFARKSKH